MEKKINLIGFIYKLVSPDNKIYIWQTINYEQRCRKYKYNAFKGQLKLWNNCQKYKWNPVDTIEIIEICNREVLNDREIYWIKYFSSNINGLNLDCGGKGKSGFYHSNETKEKLKLINLGRKHSDETKNKISKSSMGRVLSNESKEKIGNFNRGKKLSTEQKLKISAANIGNKKRLNKKHSDETKNKISKSKIGISNINDSFKIICINTGEIFLSQKDAANKLGLNQASISRVCTKIRKSYNGLIFMFYDEYLKINKNE
jgi:group I intron endonuclease